MNRKFRVLPLAAAMLLSACASGTGNQRPPATPLETAQIAVARADEARVGDFAHEDMINAREHLAAARDAARRADAGGERDTRQFAEETIADVELATAKAQYARIQAATFALQQQLGLIAPPPPETMQPEPDTIPDAPPSFDAPATPSGYPQTQTPTVNVPLQTAPQAGGSS